MQLRADIQLLVKVLVKVWALWALLFLLFLMVRGVNTQTPTPDPCATLGASLAAARLEASTGAIRLGSLEKELAETKGQLGDASNRLGVERNNVADMVDANKRANGQIAELRETVTERDGAIAIVTAERDAALLKIKKANGTNMCKLFHLGCIK